jgi:hypothetical protein
MLRVNQFLRHALGLPEGKGLVTVKDGKFENDRVRVLRIRYGAGEKSVMHSHPKSIAVFLTDAHGKFTYPDGKTEDINAKAGTVAHGCPYAPARKPQQETIRGYCCGVEALGRYMMAI